MSEIVKSLYEDHANMVKLLQILDQQLGSFKDAGPIDYEIIGDVVTYCREYPELYHHPKEERIFALVAERKPDMSQKFKNLVVEHKVLSDLTENFAEMLERILMDVPMPRTAFEAEARRFVDQQHRHIKIEEEIFFPMALEILNDNDWAAIEASINETGRDPVFAINAITRYDRLREEIRTAGLPG